MHRIGTLLLVLLLLPAVALALISEGRSGVPYFNHVFFLQKKLIKDGRVVAVSLAYTDPHSEERCRNGLDVFGGRELFRGVPEGSWVLIDYQLQSILVAEGFVGDADVSALTACPDVGTCIAWSEERNAQQNVTERRKSMGDTAAPHKVDSADLQDALTVGRSLVKAARCRGCHRLEGFGADHAPGLTWKRFKYEGGWLETYLARPYRMRPGMSDLMMLNYTSERADPSLQPQELSAIAHYLTRVATAKVPDERFRNEQWEAYICYSCHARLYKQQPLQFVPTHIPGQLRQAVSERPILQTCLGCHPFGNLREVTPAGKKSPTARATDLVLAFEKVSLNYLEVFLTNPAYFEPGTQMPNLWLTEEQIHQVLQIARQIKELIAAGQLQPVRNYFEMGELERP